MKLKYLFLFLIGALLFVGCDQRKHVKKYKILPKTEVVTVYRVHNKTNIVSSVNRDNDWIYYYLISDNGGHYYSASSPTPTTSYSSLNWTRAAVSPIKALSEIPEEEVEEMETETVETADLGMAVEQEIAIDIPEVNSLDSMEGVSMEVDSVDSSSSDSSSSSGDSGGGSSDSGSSGGDSGGGGDGGGGE